MADDWTRMRSDLYRDPKVCAMADFLLNSDTPRPVTLRSVMRNAVVGALVSVWGICRRRGKRVNDHLLLRGVALTIIDELADLPRFGQAMASVGWVRERKKGLVFPRFFEEWNADPADATRQKNAQRQRRHRERYRNVTGNVTVTDKSNIEERREEKSKEIPPTPSFPAPLNTDAFGALWLRWVQHRSEIKKPLKPTMASAQLKVLASWGEAEATRRLERSIANGWQGFDFPDNGRAGAEHPDKAAATAAKRREVDAIAAAKRREAEKEALSGPEVRERLKAALGEKVRDGP